MEDIIALSWKCESNVGGNSPEDFVYDYSGGITVTNDIDEDEPAGHFEAQYVDLQTAFNKGLGPHYVLDATAESYQYTCLFDEHGEYSKEVNDVLSDQMTGNLLIVHLIWFTSKYRGRDNGLKVLEHLIRRSSLDWGVIAIEPSPLQFLEKLVNKEDLASYKESKDVSTEKLQRHYERLGFIALPDTKYMLRNASMGLEILPKT